MAYKKPYIDEAGLHIPSYKDILEDLIAKMKQIYGEDIYLEEDSQDYQMLSIFALKQYDTMQLLELIYNNRSPKFAVGTGLDSLVKINGIRRKQASYSTVKLKLTGEIDAVINNGIVSDDSGNKWILPGTIIFETETVYVTARSKEIGAIQALANSITKIDTPTKGWISVTNPEAAIVGLPIETDEQLRVRQTLSVANPSRSIKEGLEGSLAALPNVKRHHIYENDTNLVDQNGIPSHSISVVIEGGLDSEIAKEIYLRKGPGCGTFGTTLVNHITKDGSSAPIKFFRPVQKSVFLKIKVKKLFGFTKYTEEDIKRRLSEYINALNIGQTLYTSSLWAVALNATHNLSNPTFAITSVELGTDTNSMRNADLKLNFNEVAVVSGIEVVEVN